MYRLVEEFIDWAFVPSIDWSIDWLIDYLLRKCLRYEPDGFLSCHSVWSWLALLWEMLITTPREASVCSIDVTSSLSYQIFQASRRATLSGRPSYPRWNHRWSAIKRRFSVRSCASSPRRHLTRRSSSSITTHTATAPPSSPPTVFFINFWND